VRHFIIITVTLFVDPIYAVYSIMYSTVSVAVRSLCNLPLGWQVIT